MHDLSEYEIKHSARLLIAKYGANAEDFAEIRIIQMETAKNNTAARAWAKILAAIQDVRGQERGTIS